VYKGMTGTPEEGKIIMQDEALNYACERCGIKLTKLGYDKDSKEFRKAFVEWFFSGNFIEVKEEN